MRNNKAVLITIGATMMIGSVGACSNANNNGGGGNSNSTSTGNTNITQTNSSNVSSSVKDNSINSGLKSDKSLGEPTELVIPSINFDKKLYSGGLDSQGEINPNPGHVEWYNKTVVPGDVGNSVIAGHVTYNGPDVFVNLDKVKKDDKITVKYSTGKSKTFIVNRTKSVDKVELQNDQSVWGISSKPSLILITCDAKSKLIGHHHVDNFAVWTTPIS